MAKQKIDKNYLDFIPVKNPEIKYETNDYPLGRILQQNRPEIFPPSKSKFHRP